MPGKCCFNELWLEILEYKEWLRKCPENKSKAKCCFCTKTIDLSNMGEAAVKTHMADSKVAVLSEISCFFPKEMDLNFMSALLDEVALEGLDGITIPMLWTRLQNRPNFPIALDEESKGFLWDCIAVHKDIEIYELPTPRELVPIYNRYEHIDSELGIVLEPTEKVVDSYPVLFVKDGDVRGSCSTYDTRVRITTEIRYDDVILLSLREVLEKWGEKLVLVASPKARLLALIGTETNPMIEMSQEEYCLLERIGRSRYLGEVTQGEGGLLNLKAPFCKQLHYYRKKLTLKGLVTKQLHYMKNKKGQATTGSLFHITRFHVPRKTKMELLMKCMCDLLKEKPQNRELSRVLREELNIRENTFKKLFYRPFQKWVKVITLPYKEFYPEAPLRQSHTANGQDRLIKVVQLIRHCDDIDNTEEEETSDDKVHNQSLNVHFDCSKIYYDMPLITQVYKIILEAGPEGVTSADLGRIITLPRLDIRTLLKSLKRRDCIVTVLQERGRQKETKYIAKQFSVQNEAYSKIKEGEEELSKTDLPVNKSGKKVNSLKRKNTSVDNPPSKKVRFSDEVSVVMDEPVESENTVESSEEINFQKIVSEVSEIQGSDVFTGKAPKLISLSEEIANPILPSSTTQLTHRKLIRMNIVLDHLKSVGFSTLTDIQKHLMDKEREEGYNFKLDKKSTARMIHKLHIYGKLKIIKAVLRLDNQKSEIEFICDKSIEDSDQRISSAVEQHKFKFFSLYRDKQKKPVTNTDKDKISSEEKCVDESKQPEKKTMDSVLVQKSLSEAHTHPKCLRFKTFHKFLFYLVYQYEGHSGDKSRVPSVYHDSMTWKRFVSPLPTDLKEGWCFLAHVYARMPLSILVKVVNLRQKIEEFRDYLMDEEKRHYPITHLSRGVFKSLIGKRRYLFAFDDVLKCLCYMGLLTFGPQSSKQKEQLYVYIHRKAALKDTTISTPGYLHINTELTYEKKIFSFNTLADVERFWMELESICFHTPLGKYSSMAGKTIAIAEPCHKPELIESLKNKTFDEITDVGFIPGDGLGAGGFDSSLFLHSRRNWQSSNSVKSTEKNSKSDPNANPTISIQNLLKNKEMLGPEGRNRLQRLSRYRLSSPKDKTMKENSQKKTKSENTKKTKAESSKVSAPAMLPKKRKRVKFRTVKLRSKKIRTPYFDEKDKEAIQRMSRARCEWSSQEDSFLLLCKVASSFLDPCSRTLVVPYTVVRDLLHEKFPAVSANKSSRACQRRVRYMMMNPTTANNVAVFLGEAKQDKNLVKKFDRVKPAKTNETVWKELFTGVLKSLLEKFTLPAADRCKNIPLPDNIDAFNKKFEVMSPRNVFNHKSNHKNPENDDEVIYSTLYSLIVSAMAIIQDGTEWSYLLYKLYQVYPEYVLRSVVSRLRSEKVIAIKKKTCKKDLERSLMSTFPYRFSITYENTMLTKFPIKLFNEAKELIDNLKCIHNNEEGLELKGDIAPGYAAAVLALVPLNQLSLAVKVPEQIILFDTSLSKEVRSNIVERMILTLSNKESVELSRLLNNEKDTSTSEGTIDDQNGKEKLNELAVRQAKENLKKKFSGESTQTNEVQRSSNASRFALYLLRQELSQPPVERVQHSQDYIVLNSCRVFCHLRPHVTQNEPRVKRLTDGCISEIKASLTAYIPPEAFDKNRNFEDSLEQIYDAYSPQTLNDAKNIFEEIYKLNSVGISERSIWEKFRVLNGELSLFEHLHLFKEAMLVMRVGIASFVYVCLPFAKNWILTSYALPDMCYRKKSKENDTQLTDSNSRNVSDVEMEDLQANADSEMSRTDLNDNNKPAFQSTSDYSTNVCLQDPAITFTKEVYFLPRTWRHPDGTLNKTVFIELLQTVLSFIISSPGVNTSRVTERFSLALQPVQILELLEILEKACCIVKYYTKKPPKRTLFSNPLTISITKSPGPDDLDHLEPLRDAVCNLSKIQEAIMQK